eukprot:gene174-209_t
MQLKLILIRNLVTNEQQDLFKKNAVLLESIQKDLHQYNAPEESVQILRDALDQLKESLFLLVVVGEFNSGKSSFLNALLGNTYLKEGITPTTSKINILKFGEKHTNLPGRNDETEVISLPVPWLKDISLVDTPGTNAVIKGHQQITEHFIPRSDMILFVTSVDRAFSESERIFLNTIRQWRKKIVVVLSKADLVESNPMGDPAADLAEVQKFVSDNFAELLGENPVLFPVSAKKALKGKLAGGVLASNASWTSSRFAALEEYILHTLDTRERARLKLLNPLGVAENVLSSVAIDMAARAKVLSVDVRTLEHVESQLGGFRSELERDLSFHLMRIENLILKMETRADAFLDEQIQLSNIFKLLRSDEIKLRFEKEVVGSTTHEIETHISALIDWIVEKNANQWRNIMDYIDSRSSSRLEKLIGNVNRNGDFLHTRNNLLKNIGESTTQTLSVYNKENEAIKLSNEIRSTIYKTAVIEVGAVGLGTLLTASLLDISGIIGFGVLAVGGLALLPIKKQALKRSVHSKIADLRQNLGSVLKHHFESEVETGIQKMKDGISPFSTYVTVESEKMASSQSKIQSHNKSILGMKEQIMLLK